jgi:hypothetical protein
MPIWEKLAGLLPVDLTLPIEITVARVTKIFSTKSIVKLKFQTLTLHEACVTRTSILNFPFEDFCIGVSPLEFVTPGERTTDFMSYRHYHHL